MTICVAVAVYDGVVFAADSATTLSSTFPDGRSEVINVFKHGMKVFNLYKGKPIAAMTCGIGNFGSQSIASLAKEFRYSLMNGGADKGINGDNYTIEEVAQKAKLFLFDEKFKTLSPSPAGVFEFWIAGYSSDMSKSYEIWKIVINGGVCGEPSQLCQSGQSGLWWGGMASPVTRLLMGFDETLYAGINQVLESAGVANPDDRLKQVSDIVNIISSHSMVQLHSPSMPIQDAIELAEYLADVAKRYYRFHPGSDIVGGDTDVAVVSRYEGFKWISRKHYYPVALNRLETDHV